MVKQLTSLALGILTAMAANTTHATVVTSDLPDSGAIAVETNSIHISAIPYTTSSATAIQNGLQIDFVAPYESQYPGLGAAGIYLYPSTLLGGLNSLPLTLNVPLTFSGDGSTSGYMLNIEGASGGTLTATGPWNAEYQYHLTVSAADSDGSALDLIDQTGSFAINTGSMTPFSASALIPTGYDLSSLTARLSVNLVYLPVEGSSSPFTPIGTTTNAFGAASITSMSIQAVPEPSTWALMGLGLAGLGLASRHHRRH